MAIAGTLTRADLCDELHGRIGLSRAECSRMVEAIIAGMTTALIRGENVKISGFGSFMLRDKAERMGRNPKTGQEVPITPRRVLTFKPSEKLRERVAKAH